MATTIKVKATDLGFLHNRRYRAGEEFVLREIIGLKKDSNRKGAKSQPVTVSAEAQFNQDWMEKVEVKEPAKEKVVEETETQETEAPTPQAKKKKKKASGKRTVASVI